jgi:hypothetical protein
MGFLKPFSNAPPGRISMKTIAFGATLATLIVSSAVASAKVPKIRVTVVENVPQTSSYSWQVAGRGSVSCYGSSCSSYYMPSNGGQATVHGAIVRLLLPDGRIVIARCMAKPDVAINIAYALAMLPASTMYRDCRMPDANSTIDAEFSRSNVKLFMQAPSIDGSGRFSSETYLVTGVLQPEPIAERPAQTETRPEMGSNAGAAISLSDAPTRLSSSSPAAQEEASNTAATSETQGLLPPQSPDTAKVTSQKETPEELAKLVLDGQASRCAVLTVPPHAVVYIDGIKEGMSPDAFILVKHGDTPRIITTTMNGYKTVDTPIVPDGTIVHVELIMEKQ